jgi:RNA polymerase sigma-70 factor (ECF subfamily)
MNLLTCNGLRRYAMRARGGNTISTRDFGAANDYIVGGAGDDFSRARCRLTDADLLHRARRGDAEAWRTLYQRYLPGVWRQAYALVSDAHAAEDVTSETMLALLRSIGRLESDAPRIAGWLRVVVQRKAADYQRKKFRTRDKSTAVMGSEIQSMEEASPSAPLETAETQDRVLVVLAELSDRYRSMLEWKYLDALAVREIAERVGETEKAVEATLYRARREFRRLYELKQQRRNVTQAPNVQAKTKPEP